MTFIKKLILLQVARRIESTEKEVWSDDLIEKPGLMIDTTRNGRKVNRF